MTCRYVSTSPGIRCVLKNSCDDFIVREIDKDGKVVDLVSEELPTGIFAIFPNHTQRIKSKKTL